MHVCMGSLCHGLCCSSSVKSLNMCMSVYVCVYGWMGCWLVHFMVYVGVQITSLNMCMCASMDVCVGGWVSGSCYGLCCVASVFGVWLVGSYHGLCYGSSLNSLHVFTEEVEEVLGSGGENESRGI